MAYTVKNIMLLFLIYRSCLWNIRSCYTRLWSLFSRPNRIWFSALNSLNACFTSAVLPKSRHVAFYCTHNFWTNSKGMELLPGLYLNLLCTQCWKF